MRRLRRLLLRIALRLLLVEAMLYLLAARAALSVVPFRRLVPFFESPAKKPEITGARRELARAVVGWAIEVAAGRLPGETVCFPRAIAAQAMLRRRGVSTMLYYGAATLPQRGLTAHAWVQDGAAGVVGHQSAPDYHVLACYPQQG